MPCSFDEIETENLDQCINAEVQAGISEVNVFYALHSNITTFPMPIGFDDPTFTYEKAVEVSTPIVFQAGKGFGKIAIQAETGEVQLEGAGNPGNMKLKSVFPFFVAGNDKKLLGFIRTRLNNPMVFCVAERSGQKRLIGDRFNPAYFREIKGTTGKGGGDDKGVQFSIESWGVPIVYESTIQLPAVTP
jgi:hypothetical protein